MRRVVLSAIVLIALAAPAATQPTAPAPEPQSFTLTLSPAEVNLIGVALASRPYGEVAELIGKLFAQVQAQRAAAQQPKPTTPAPDSK